MEELDPVPGTQYDILKHLDLTFAKISILELIKRSQTHQDALRAFLQRVMVSEDMNVGLSVNIIHFSSHFDDDKL